MKYRYPFLFACAGFLFASSTVDAQNIQIMPFGDSMTAFGTSPESSYRYWLFVDLTNAGFFNFDFIGNQNGVAGGGAPANDWPEESYEGGADDDGIDTAGGLDIAQSDAASRSPDVVLLELGANDVFSGIPPSQSAANLESIVQAFATVNPNVVVVIATPPKFKPDPTLPKQEQNQERNALAKVDGVIGKVVSTERKAGVNITQVSLGGFSPKTDSSDGTHPNVKGEQFIAKQFFNGLKRAKVF
jgi:lysophospholipase L1-like esterase